MYSGVVVESGTVTEVFDRMRHPYTRGLFGCIPLPGADKTSRPLVPIRGQLPLPHQRPPGCYFAPRCDFFQAGNCDREGLAMTQVPGEPGHDVRCRRWQQIDWSTYKPEGVGAGASQGRPATRGVGKESGRTGRSQGEPDKSKKKTVQNTQKK